MAGFLGYGAPRMSRDEKIAMAETEVDLMQDMYSKLAQTCTRKCIPKEYREGELNKGESVCIDRCVAKYMEVNVKIGEKMQQDAAGKQSGGGAPGLGAFGR